MAKTKRGPAACDQTVTVIHERDCDCAPEDVWQCITCGRLFGHCHGAHLEDDTDKENDSCDECWLELQRRKGAA